MSVNAIDACHLIWGNCQLTEYVFSHDFSLSFQVPYGCMVPVGADNLLVAGRCVAGDKTSHAAMRNMMACTVTGQGAGVAAAISLRDGVSTANVNMKEVQAELLRQGVKIT
jgi:hypothetical protein